MKKTSDFHPCLLFMLVGIPLILLFVTPEPYYEIVQKFGRYPVLLGMGVLFFTGIKKIIQKRQVLSTKVETETIEERTKREKERSHTVVIYGIILGILYLLYIIGMFPE